MDSVCLARLHMPRQTRTSCTLCAVQAFSPLLQSGEQGALCQSSRAGVRSGLECLLTSPFQLACGTAQLQSPLSSEG